MASCHFRPCCVTVMPTQMLSETQDALHCTLQLIWITPTASLFVNYWYQYICFVFINLTLSFQFSVILMAFFGEFDTRSCMRKLTFYRIMSSFTVYVCVRLFNDLHLLL